MEEAVAGWGFSPFQALQDGDQFDLWRRRLGAGPPEQLKHLQAPSKGAEAPTRTPSAHSTASSDWTAAPARFTRRELEAIMNQISSEILPWTHNYTFVKQLQEAERNQGRVELMRDPKDGDKPLAVKVMPNEWVCHSPEEFRKANADSSEQPWEDLAYLKKLNSLNFPYVCDFYKVYRDRRETYVATSFCSVGDLFSWVEHESVARPGPEREAQMVPIVSQIFNAVRWLHDFGIAHRDLSLENILLTKARGGEFSVKIIDFGMAILEQFCSEERGKLAYQAPEMHAGGTYDAFLADDFALGVVLYGMAAQDYPWASTKKNSCQLFEYVCNLGFRRFLGHRRLRKGCNNEPLTEVFSNDFSELLEGMLDLRAGSRTALGEQVFSDPTAGATVEPRPSVWSAKWCEGMVQRSMPVFCRTKSPPSASSQSTPSSWSSLGAGHGIQSLPLSALSTPCGARNLSKATEPGEAAKEELESEEVASAAPSRQASGEPTGEAASAGEAAEDEPEAAPAASSEHASREPTEEVTTTTTSEVECAPSEGLAEALAECAQSKDEAADLDVVSPPGTAPVGEPCPQEENDQTVAPISSTSDTECSEATVCQPQPSSSSSEHGRSEEGSAQELQRFDSLPGPRSPRFGARDTGVESASLSPSRRGGPSTHVQRVAAQRAAATLRPGQQPSSGPQQKVQVRTPIMQPRELPLAARDSASSLISAFASRGTGPAKGACMRSGPATSGVQSNPGSMQLVVGSAASAAPPAGTPRTPGPISVLDQKKQVEVGAWPSATSQRFGGQFPVSQPTAHARPLPPSSPCNSSTVELSSPCNSSSVELRNSMAKERLRLGGPSEAQRTGSALIRQQSPADRSSIEQGAQYAVRQPPGSQGSTLLRQHTPPDLSSAGQQGTPRAVKQPQSPAGPTSARVFGFQAPDRGQPKPLEGGVARQVRVMGSAGISQPAAAVQPAASTIKQRVVERSGAASVGIPQPGAAVRLAVSPIKQRVVERSSTDLGRARQPVAAASPSLNPIKQPVVQRSSTGLAGAQQPVAAVIKQRFEQVGPGNAQCGQGQRIECSMASLSQSRPEELPGRTGSIRQLVDEASMSCGSLQCMSPASQHQRVTPQFPEQVQRQDSECHQRAEVVVRDRGLEPGDDERPVVPEVKLAAAQAKVADPFAGLDLRSLDGPVSVRFYQQDQHSRGIGQHLGGQGSAPVPPLVRQAGAQGNGPSSHTVGCMPFSGFL